MWPADGALGYLLTERTLHHSRQYFAKTKNKDLSVALVKRIRPYDKKDIIPKYIHKNIHMHKHMCMEATSK